MSCKGLLMGSWLMVAALLRERGRSLAHGHPHPLPKENKCHSYSFRGL